MIISLEMGSSYIKIYDYKLGLIFYEPSLVIYKEKNKKSTLVSFGKNALENLLRLEDGEKAIQPIKNGIITNFYWAKVLLNSIFNNLIGNIKKRNSLEIVLCVPTCSTTSQIDEFIKLLNSCGVTAITIKPQLTCACKLLDDDLSRPYLIVDIGAGKTEIGLTTINNVIEAISLSLGGSMVNLSIQETIKNNYNILIPKVEIERLKKSVSSLYSTDATTIKVLGQDLSTNKMQNYVVSSQDIYESITLCYDKIFEAILVFLNSLDKEYQDIIRETGIFFTGLGCEITGFEKYARSKLNLNVYILDSPDVAVVEGALINY